MAGKLHSIPRQFFNGFSAAHGFTLLKIAVVRAVRSLVLISQPLIEPKWFIIKCMLFHSIFPLYPTKQRLLQRLKFNPGYLATLDHSASSHPQQAPITGEFGRHVPAWVLRMRFVSTSEGHGYETRHILSIPCSTAEANRAHDTNVERMGRMHHTANCWVNASH